MASRPVEVSVVLPAYNEAATLRDTVTTTLETLEAFLPAGSFEVLVAEDGCEDETPAIASALAADDERVRHVHSDERLGRGGALERAFDAAGGDTLAYLDTDMATDMRHLEELIESVRSGDYDVATGSRWLPGHEASRPAKRGVPSRGYNFLVRRLLGSSLRDHQCGFKALDREAFEALRHEVADDHWFWDTELLVRAQRRGYRVREFPVEWEPKGDSSVDLVRDVLGMGSQVGRCWWEFAVRPHVTRRTGAVLGVLLVLVALGLMTLYLDPAAVLAEMRAADPVLVGLAAVVYALSWPLRGLRYRDILAELDVEGDVGFLTGAIFVSQTGNLVFPARAGDAVRAYVMKARRGVPYATGFASLAVERVFDLLTITALAGTVLVGFALASPDQFAAVVSAATGGSGAGETAESGATAVAVAAAVGALAVLAVAVIVLSARSDRQFVRGAVRRVSDDRYADWVADHVERFTGDVQVVTSDRAAFARVGATSVLVWGIDVATAVLVLLAFPGVDLPLGTLLAVGFFAVSVGNLAKVLPLSPGGIGLYEGAFTVLVVALTPLSAPLALGAAVLDHAVKNGVTVAGGVLSTLVLNVSLAQAVEGGHEVERAAAGEESPDGKA